jgi:hypothetical protein
MNQVTVNGRSAGRGRARQITKNNTGLLVTNENIGFLFS